jgi:hypothetical protein
MPKPTKRKRPPDRVNRLCKAVEQLTAARQSRSHGSQWVAMADVARRLGISEAEAEAAMVEVLTGNKRGRNLKHWQVRQAAGDERGRDAKALRSLTAC